jgi:hypothetical protein
VLADNSIFLVLREFMLLPDLLIRVHLGGQRTLQGISNLWGALKRTVQSCEWLWNLRLHCQLARSPLE